MVSAGDIVCVFLRCLSVFPLERLSLYFNETLRKATLSRDDAHTVRRDCPVCATRTRVIAPD